MELVIGAKDYDCDVRTTQYREFAGFLKYTASSFAKRSKNLSIKKLDIGHKVYLRVPFTIILYGLDFNSAHDRSPLYVVQGDGRK
jgi:hypothetical protein